MVRFGLIDRTIEPATNLPITNDYDNFDIRALFAKDGRLWMSAEYELTLDGNVSDSFGGNFFELTTSPDARQYIREGSVFEVDLTEHVIDGTNYFFSTGYTAPNWLSITDGKLTGTVPSVLVDTEITVLVTASNVHGATDFSVNLVLVDLAPTVGTVTEIEVLEGNTFESALHLFVSSPRTADGHVSIIESTYTFRSGYMPPDWVMLIDSVGTGSSGVNSVLSGLAPQVDVNTDFRIELTVTNPFGSSDFEVPIRVLDGSPYQTQEIPPQEVVEGHSYNLNLATYTDFGTDYEFTTGYTPPSWLTIVSSNISGTAPAVTADRQITLEATVSNEDGFLDLVIPLTIRNGLAPVIPPLASQGLVSDRTWAVDLRTLVPTALTFRFQDDYTPPNWLILGVNGVLETLAAPIVTGANFVEIVRLIATNIEGSTNFALTLIVQPQNVLLGIGITQNAEQYQGFREFEILLDITARDSSRTNPTAGAVKALRVPALVVQDLSSLDSYSRNYSLTYIGASQVIVLRQPINGLRAGDLIFKTLNQDTLTREDFEDNVDRYWLVESIDFIAENQKQVITAQFVLTVGAI